MGAERGGGETHKMSRKKKRGNVCIDGSESDLPMKNGEE